MPKCSNLVFLENDLVMSCRRYGFGVKVTFGLQKHILDDRVAGVSTQSTLSCDCIAAGAND